MRPEDRAAQFGLELRRGRPRYRGPVETRVRFFRAGDPEHTFVTRDGKRIPKGAPIDELRKKLGGNEGYFEDPFGGKHRIAIPTGLRGDDWYAAISFRTLGPIGRNDD